MMLASCSEINTDYQYLFPEEYNKVLYIRDNGTVKLELPDLASFPEYTYSFEVIKAGSNPDLDAEARITVLSKEELAETYGADYQLLPEDTYSISTAPLQFSAEDMSKTVDVVFRTAAIKALLEQAKSTLCVPVELTSENSTVNSTKNSLLIEISAVTTPRLRFSGDDQVLVFESTGASSQTVEIGAELLGVTTNAWNFNSKISVSTDQSFVEAFAELYGFNKEDIIMADNVVLSPSDAVFNFISGKSESSEKIKVTVSAKDMTPGKIYIIPLQFTECSMDGFIASDEVQYVAGIIPDPQKISLSADMLSSPHSETLYGEGDLAKLVDNNKATHWSSDYNGMLGVSPLGHYFDVDLTSAGNNFHTFRLGYTLRNDWNPTAPYTINIYGSTDGQEYFLITTLTHEENNLPNSDNADFESSIYFSLKRFNHIRFAVTRTYRINNDVPTEVNLLEDVWGFFNLAEFRLWAK